MKRVLLLGVGVASVAAFCFYLDTAQAQPRSASGKCRTMSEVYGSANIWWGRFTGGRQPVRINRGLEYRAFEACFYAQRDCETWLSGLQSEYSHMPKLNECRQGYAPRRSVTP